MQAELNPFLVLDFWEGMIMPAIILFVWENARYAAKGGAANEEEAEPEPDGVAEIARARRQERELCFSTVQQQQQQQQRRAHPPRGSSIQARL